MISEIYAGLDPATIGSFQGTDIQLLDPALSIPIQVFEDSIAAPERVSVSLARSTRSYQGNWFRMPETSNTCVLWSFANACLLLGINPDVQFLQSVAQETIEGSIIFERGITLQELEERINNDGAASVVLNHHEDLLKSSARSTKRLDILQHNAKTIKTHIDRMQGLVCSVDMRAFFEAVEHAGKRGDFQPHAVCVMGYRVNDDQSMDIQVTDPARGGIAWMSLEHFSNALIEEDFPNTFGYRDVLYIQKR